jgi:hypothetical protein
VDVRNTEAGAWGQNPAAASMQQKPPTPASPMCRASSPQAMSPCLGQAASVLLCLGQGQATFPKKPLLLLCSLTPRLRECRASATWRQSLPRRGRCLRSLSGRQPGCAPRPAPCALWLCHCDTRTYLTQGLPLLHTHDCASLRPAYVHRAYLAPHQPLTCNAISRS